MESITRDTTKSDKESTLGFGGGYEESTNNSYLFFLILWFAFFKSDLDPRECKKVCQQLEKLFDKDIESQKDKEKGED